MSSEEESKLDSTNLDSEQNSESEKLTNKEKGLDKTQKAQISSKLDELPDDIKTIVKMMSSSSRISASSYSSLTNSLEDKINTDHISEILRITERDNKRGFEDIKSARRYNLITLVIILVFLGFLTVFLANKDLSTYQDIIRIIIIFGGGFGAGYGYKSKIK